jgi:hypothetical protein
MGEKKLALACAILVDRGANRTRSTSLNRLTHREIAQFVGCKLVTFAVVLCRERATHRARVVALFLPTHVIRVSSSRVDGRTVLQEPKQVVLHLQR